MHPLALLPALVLAAQAPGATVTGHVLDAETGLAIRGATVALDDLGVATVSDSDGLYRISGVAAGPQHLVVQAVGYVARQVHALIPAAGSIELHVALDPDPIPLERLDVPPPDAATTLPAGPRPVLVDSISMAAVLNHPMLAEPDALLALDHGVVTTAAEAPEGMHVLGGASDHTAFEIDGIPVFSPYHSTGRFGAWNPDALGQIELEAGTAPGASAAALSGVVRARSRVPGSRLGARSRLSTSHRGLTVDGPLGSGGVLVSLRSGYPSFSPGDPDPTRLRGENGDGLLTVHAPLAGGRVMALAFGSESEVDAAAVIPSDTRDGPPPRNDFEWASRSLGLLWDGTVGGTRLRGTVWHAQLDAEATWSPGNDGSTDVAVDSRRTDVGSQVEMSRGSETRFMAGGVRLEHSRTGYVASARSGAERELNARTPVASLFAHLLGPLGARGSVWAGATVWRTGGATGVSPDLRLQWSPTSSLTLQAGLARSHQFAQSLRNGESVAGRIFPVDLPIGADHDEVPIARADHLDASARLRVTPTVSLEGRAWTRTLRDLVLVAPTDAGPFSADSLSIGSGTARGLAVNGRLTRARLSILTGWSWQRVRHDADGIGYQPQYAAAHSVESGLVVFPGATTSVRLAFVGRFGRRATPVLGDFEWEACNLIDGCEFVGLPETDQDALGTLELPAYLRVDLAARAHWHVRVGGRDSRLGLYGMVTNVLSRRNLLGWSRDPATGRWTGLEMRPTSPLVVGVDWQF